MIYFLKMKYITVYAKIYFLKMKYITLNAMIYFLKMKYKTLRTMLRFIFGIATSILALIANNTPVQLIKYVFILFYSTRKKNSKNISFLCI